MGKNNNKGILICLIICIVVLIGLGAYIFYDKYKETNANESSNSTQKQQASTTEKVEKEEKNENKDDETIFITTLQNLKQILEKNNQNIKVDLDDKILKCNYNSGTNNYSYTFVFDNNYLAYVNNVAVPSKDYTDNLWYVIEAITYATGDMLNINREKVDSFLQAGDLEAAEEYGFIYAFGDSGREALQKFAISLTNFHVF